jgi:hypothetical protein
VPDGERTISAVVASAGKKDFTIISGMVMSSERWT